MTRATAQICHEIGRTRGHKVTQCSYIAVKLCVLRSSQSGLVCLTLLVTVHGEEKVRSDERTVFVRSNGIWFVH